MEDVLYVTMYRLWVASMKGFEHILMTIGIRPLEQLVFDHMVAQPEIIHDHMECIIFDRGRIPLEMLLDLITITLSACELLQIIKKKSKVAES
jgi:hypothetical protein